MTNQRTIDAPSLKCQFGWERIGNEDFAIPVIIRSNGIRYSPVRIVEQEIIKRYDTLPQNVFQCITLKSFYLTAAEAKLLNDINFNHCNNRYGEAFFGIKDVIISAADVKELSRFLNISHEIFSRDLTKVAANFGVIKLSKNPNNSDDYMIVPYITKSYQEKSMRFVPSTLIEGFVTKSRCSVRGAPNDWDIMYLKMLCIYSENNLQQYISKDSQIVLLDGLLYSGTGTPIIYEDFKNPLHGCANSHHTFSPGDLD